MVMLRGNKIVTRLDEMLTDAINGSFIESVYDETELSRLESKFRQYLTAKEMSEEKVRAERKAIKELVTDISHQTKTPIANICLYTQLLEEISSSDMLPYVEQIRMQAEKLEFLIQALTKISRLESDMIRLQPKAQPVALLVRKAVREMQGRAEVKNIRITVEHASYMEYEEAIEYGRNTDHGKAIEYGRDIDHGKNIEHGKAIDHAEKLVYKKNMEYAADSEEIHAVYDARWTGEALGNLLDNSVKYSPESSRIRVSVKALELFVRISVEDEGPGIPVEERAQIFERFYRGKNAARADGTGVGLYLTRMILQRERGYVKVSSGARGGSCFHLYLPKA